MQLFSRKKALFAASLVALGGLAACGDDVTVPVAPEPLPDPVVVTISPPNATMNVGEALTFAVQITGGNPTPTLASCTSSNTSVATAAVQGAGCRVSAVASGNVTITAATSAGQSAAAAVTVNTLPAAATGMVISPSAVALARGQTATLTAALQGARPGATLGSLTQATSNSAVATAAISGSNITITAVAPGTATITITGVASGAGSSNANVSAQVGVTVTEAPGGIAALTVQPTSLALALGSTAQLTAQVTQPTGAPQATVTYGTSAPAIASVSSTGLVTALQPGTATITVTASSPAATGFSASSVTQLVPVTVSPSANVTIAEINQGPIVTSYVNDSSSTLGGRQAGIVTAANPQVNQPIDITNTRDQIQVIANLQPNGQRVDSIVVFIAPADAPAARRAAARQVFSNGTANAGSITLFINTADFTANFDNGTADVFYPNGQKIISVAAFTTDATGPRQVQEAANFRSSVNFNNIDGYAARYVNPTRTASNPDNGFNWWGGPGAEGTGSATIVPVFYTAGRSVSSLTLGMRQGLVGTIDICSSWQGAGFSRETYTAAPFRATYNGDIARNTSTTGQLAVTTGNQNIECAGYEHPAVQQQNIMGVLAGVDNANNPAPLVTFADGYRFSTAVPRPVANRLDYLGPATVEPDIRRARTPASGSNWMNAAITGWVNESFSFGQTANGFDNGVGTTNTRSWRFRGCGAGNAGGSDTLSVAMATATGASIPECNSNATGGWNQAGTPAGNYELQTRGPYTVYYVEADRLGNSSESQSSQPFGVDKTAPDIRWSSASSADTTVGPFAFQAEVLDNRAGFIQDAEDNGSTLRGTAPTLDATTEAVASVGARRLTRFVGFSATGNFTLATATWGSQQHFASRGAGSITSPAERTNCVNPNNNAPVQSNSVNVSGGSAWHTNPNCAFIQGPAAAISTPLVDGYRSAFNFAPATNGIWKYRTRVFDRAGNESATLTRSAARDLAVPVVISDLNVPVTMSASANPQLSLVASDNVEIRASTTWIRYSTQIPGGRALVYPQQLLDARFNDVVNSPLQPTITVATPTPFPIAIQSVNAGGVYPTTAGNYANVVNAQAQLWDVNNTGTASAIVPFLQAGITAPASTASLGAANGALPASARYTSFRVLSSRAAGFNAGVGLKAQVESNTEVTNTPFVRVDFYRARSGGNFEYLGSVANPAAADQGTTRWWTYNLPESEFAFRTNDLSTRQDAGQPGDEYIAIGVRSNGAGLVTEVTGEAQRTLQITVTGIPAGLASITVTGPNGYNVAVTGSTTLSVPQPATSETYTITASTVTSGSAVYVPTATQQFVVVNNSGPQATATVTYQSAQVSVTVAGLPTGTPANFTITGPSGYSQTVTTQTNGTATYTGPAAGTYTVTPANVTVGSLTYTPTLSGACNAAVVLGTPNSCTITYANSVPFISVSVTVPTGSGVVPDIGTGGGSPSTITTTGTTLVTYATAATQTFTVNPVTVAGITYGNGTSPFQLTAASSLAGGSLTIGYFSARVTLAAVTSAPPSGGTGWQLPVTVTGPGGFSQTQTITVDGGAGSAITLPAASFGNYQASFPTSYTVGGETYTIGCPAAPVGQVVGSNCLIAITAPYQSAPTAISVTYTP
jgi:uncharacterized protein YjdB